MMNVQVNPMKTNALLLVLLCFAANVFGFSKDDMPLEEDQTWYWDGDGDGFGDPAISIVSATQPVGYVANDQDCNDGNPVVNPGQEEICNGIDDNCDGRVDELVVPIWYKDLDNDGFSDGTTLEQCTEPGGYKLAIFLNALNGDCDDENPTVNPGTPETCNSIDDNCDGQVDEGVMVTWFKDLDNDLYSDGTTVQQCTEPGGYKKAESLFGTSGDCDDENPAVNPGATETCKSKEDN